VALIDAIPVAALPISTTWLPSESMLQVMAVVGWMSVNVLVGPSVRLHGVTVEEVGTLEAFAR
jgi:hypothetical protein